MGLPVDQVEIWNVTILNMGKDRILNNSTNTTISKTIAVCVVHLALIIYIYLTMDISGSNEERFQVIKIPY